MTVPSVRRTTGAQPVRRRSTRPVGAKSNRTRYALVVLAFLLPSALPLLAFTLGPMIAAAWVSLNQWNLLAPMKFIGLGNYITLFTDPNTGDVFLHTVYYVAGYLPI
ncbi:MAG TPA: hypothetical protein VGM38_01485, partial [Pseudolysinimonas sp.]